jgi:hypothetical protein
VAWETSCGIPIHRVADEIVWNTVKDDLPLLRRIAENALQRSSPKPPDEELDAG